MAHEQQTFRFLDLPAELRYMIYRNLLCSFENKRAGYDGNLLARILRQEPEPRGVNLLSHSVHTAILRTSKEVHKEAYDVMVKTNRFVRLTTQGQFLNQYLMRTQIPVVTLDRQHTSQFRGFVLHVSIAEKLVGGTSKDIPREPHLDLIMTGQSWDAMRDFNCVAHQNGLDLFISADVNPCSSDAAVDYKASVFDFFTTKMQLALLRPFCAYLHGGTTVQVRGTLSTSVNGTTMELVRRTSSLAPEAWASSAQKLQRAAEQHQANGKIIEAVGAWMQMSGFVQLLLRHPMTPSVSTMVAILHDFTIPANVGLCFLHHLRISTPEFSRTSFFDELAKCTLQHLHLPIVCMRRIGGPVTRVPHSVWPELSTEAKQAKMLFSYASAFRLSPGGRSACLHTVTGVSRYARLANQLDPGNVEILREVVRWKEWLVRLLKAQAALASVAATSAASAQMDQADISTT